MICAGLTLPRSSGVFLNSFFQASYSSPCSFVDYSLVYYFILWIVLLFLATSFIIHYGIDYVSWPRLIPLTSAIYYEGPGYRSAKHGMGLSGVSVKLGLDNGAKWLNEKRKVGSSDVESIPMVNKRVD